MATFSNLKANAVGTTEVTIANIITPTVLTGCNFANIIGSSASISLYIDNIDEVEEVTTTYYIVKDKNVLGNENLDVISANKIFLKNGDILKAKATVQASFDILISTMDGI
jgi:hypothetical protein